MTFFDWWGFLGTGIQSIFAWMTFNRDGFADNVTWRQAQKYQQKNYNISWIAIARDDIRDMMGISVNRINNYMIVATLILSVAAGSIVSVSFSADCPAFVYFAFYLSTSISVIFLMLSIMFGVKGQNSAFTNTMKLLTYQVRPENPAEYSHDYMKQAQWVERNGLAALFRIPGIMPSYNTDADKDKLKTLSEHVDDFARIESGEGLKGRKQKKGQQQKQLGSPTHEPEDFDDDDALVNLEEATPLESLIMRTSHTWYLTKFAEFMRLWHPYDLYSKYAMGLGILCLGHSSAYFALGFLAVQDYSRSEYAAAIVTLAFIMMVALIINANLRTPGTVVRISIVLSVSLAPGCSTVAAVTESEVARQILVPLAFSAHLLFWLVVYRFAQHVQESDIHFYRPGEGFWGPHTAANQDEHPDWTSDNVSHGSSAQTLRQSADGPPEASRHGSSAQSDQTWHPVLRVTCCGHRTQPKPDKNAAEERRRGKLKRKRTSLPEGSYDHAHDLSGWPTDEDEFAWRAENTRMQIRSTAQSTILASASLWFAMLIWAILTYWFAEPSSPWQYAVESEDQPAISWPNPLFRPTLLACAGGLTVASDGYRIYALSLEGAAASAVNCPGVQGIIQDLSIACDPQGCSPVALTDAVVHCRYGKVPLQDAALSRFTFFEGSASSNFSNQTLLAGLGDRLVSYSQSHPEALWHPEAFLGRLNFLSELGGFESRSLRSSEGLLAMDTSALNDVVVVRHVESPRPTIQIRDGQTLKFKGQWHHPRHVEGVQSACADKDHSVLALLSSGSEVGAAPPRVIRLNLPE
mmetsp:Transcript_53995/g.126064  ORF Transcript_53995/g.126064 Transcript_53995/m.126064 type:complete len:805 (+) Transcript_53995:64-2478(+)